MMHMASLKTGYVRNRISLELSKSMTNKHVFSAPTCMVVRPGQLRAGIYTAPGTNIKYVCVRC